MAQTYSQNAHLFSASLPYPSSFSFAWVKSWFQAAEAAAWGAEAFKGQVSWRIDLGTVTSVLGLLL